MTLEIIGYFIIFLLCCLVIESFVVIVLTREKTPERVMHQEEEMFNFTPMPKEELYQAMYPDDAVEEKGSGLFAKSDSVS